MILYYAVPEYVRTGGHVPHVAKLLIKCLNI